MVYYGPGGITKKDNWVTDQYAPAQIGVDKDWKAVSSGRLHCMAIKKDHSLWTWGWNLTGQLGNGTNTDLTAPAKIGPYTDWELAVGDEGYSVALRNSTTSVKNENSGLSKLVVLPNPFSGKITIKGIGQDESLELVNAFGEIIWQGIHIQQQDFSTLQNGVYFLRINTKDKPQTVKLIKE